MDPALWEEIAEGPADEEIDVVLRLRHPDETPAGVRVVARFGDVVTGRVRRGDALGVHALDEVTSLKAAVPITPADAEPGGTGTGDDLPGPTDVRGPSADPATGRTTVIGVLDWHFDLVHPALRHPDGRSRVRAFWHQGARGGPGRTPQPYGYGRVLRREEIDAALRTADPYRELGNPPWQSPEAARGSHGTHVTSIAAGTHYLGISGVAPGADLVLVHLSERSPRQRVDLGTSASLLEGLHFVDAEAGDDPCSINLSVGRQGGHHRGISLVEQALDQLVTRRAGRFCCQSAGNYYRRRAHASAELAPGGHHELTWQVEPRDPTANELEAWYAGGDRIRVVVRSPDGEETAVPLGERAETPHCRLYHRRADSTTGLNHFQIFMGPKAPGGDWRITLIGEDVTDGRVDLWVERDDPRHQSFFAEPDVVATATLGSIACGFHTVAVGAVDGHTDGRPVAPFSSSGPTADGRRRPNLTATGVDVLAARSAPGPDGPHGLTRKSGTSMAAPHVTGAIACLYEAAGRPLDVAEARRLLITTLAPSTDGAGDPYRTGNGCLDLDRLLAAARAGAPRRTAPKEAMIMLYSPRDSRRLLAGPISSEATGATELWMPTAERLPHPKSAGLSYVGGVPWRFVFHTIEGRPSAADFRAMAARHENPPHLWAMPSADLLLQVIPLDRAAYALAHPKGTVETNRMRAIQVECWGYARDMDGVSVDVLDWLADRVLGPVSRLLPINLRNVLPTLGEQAYGVKSATRLKDVAWRDFDGVCGHQHVPGNQHWDPGPLDLTAIAARAAGKAAPVLESVAESVAEAEVDTEIHPAAEATRAGKATLEWVDLTLTPGHSGKDHLYYLTSGPTGGGDCKFRIRVTNPFDRFVELHDAAFDLRLRVDMGNGQSLDVPLDGQEKGRVYKRVRTQDVPPDTSYVQEFALRRATLLSAYNPDHPRCSLDAIYRWRQGLSGDEFVTQRSLSFYLVNPIEMMVGQRHNHRSVILDDSEHRRLIFANSTGVPQDYKISVSESNTRTVGGETVVGVNTTVTRGTDVTHEEKQEWEASGGLKIGDMFNVGMKFGGSSSTSVKWSQSVAESLTFTASRSRTFSTLHTLGTDRSGTIPPLRGGTRKAYLCPVVGIWDVPVVLFHRPNDWGQATRRTVGRTVPVAWNEGLSVSFDPPS
ncbi:S8 family serine peptidase [Actinoplanes sp. NPDC000266]